MLQKPIKPKYGFIESRICLYRCALRKAPLKRVLNGCIMKIGGSCHSYSVAMPFWITVIIPVFKLSFLNAWFSRDLKCNQCRLGHCEAVWPLTSKNPWLNIFRTKISFLKSWNFQKFCIYTNVKGIKIYNYSAVGYYEMQIAYYL